MYVWKERYDKQTSKEDLIRLAVLYALHYEQKPGSKLSSVLSALRDRGISDDMISTIHSFLKYCVSSVSSFLDSLLQRLVLVISLEVVESEDWSKDWRINQGNWQCIHTTSTIAARCAQSDQEGKVVRGRLSL